MDFFFSIALHLYKNDTAHITVIITQLKLQNKLIVTLCVNTNLGVQK